MRYRFIREGGYVPLNIVLVDKRDIEKSGWTMDEAVERIAARHEGPTGINVFDMEAVTTTSDGIMVQGAIVRMAASDKGRIHPEFGMLDMQEMEVTEDLIREEPHLAQWRNLQGKRMFRGPNPKDKLIPVHNVVITGRAANNNSATEMMNIVTMEEILLPILGQLQLMRDQEVLMGLTGEYISVGIGMTVAEKYGRVFPTRQFKAGETAHASGEYAKTLKRHIPCIVAPKSVLAEKTLIALEAGMVPGRHIGCSPAVLSIAKRFGSPIDYDNISPKAWAELESVGISKAFLQEETTTLSKTEIIEQADAIVPGVDKPERLTADRILEYLEI